MTRPNALSGALLRAGMAAALAVSLSGCISLLPKNKPAHLYRFGAPPPSVQAIPAATDALGVFWSRGEFQRASSDDRLLAITGDEAAYIGETRWAEPAEVMFEEAVQAAFETTPGHVRLVPRGLPAPTDLSLRVDVRNFETRYDAGPKAAPTVYVRLHATLTRDRERTVVSEQVFQARADAADNRVSAIVAAYDQAVRKVLGELVAWTDASAKASANAA
jgi:cholesterol transport system auxiliary component